MLFSVSFLYWKTEKYTLFRILYYFLCKITVKRHSFLFYLKIHIIYLLVSLTMAESSFIALCSGRSTPSPAHTVSKRKQARGVRGTAGKTNFSAQECLSNNLISISIWSSLLANFDFDTDFNSLRIESLEETSHHTFKKREKKSQTPQRTADTVRQVSWLILFSWLFKKKNGHPRSCYYRS